MKKLAIFLCLFVFSALAVDAAGIPDSFSSVVKKASNGVVNISTTKMVTRQIMPFFNDEFFRNFSVIVFPILVETVEQSNIKPVP